VRVCILALPIRQEKRIISTQHCTPTCGLTSSAIFFPHYLINGKIKKNALNIKCVFWYSLQFCLQHFSF